MVVAVVVISCVSAASPRPIFLMHCYFPLFFLMLTLVSFDFSMWTW